MGLVARFSVWPAAGREDREQTCSARVVAMPQGMGKLSSKKLGRKGGARGGGGVTRKNLGKTKKGGGNGKLSARKRFGAGGSGHKGREAHQAVHSFKKKRSATVRTTIEAEMAAKVLKTGQVGILTCPLLSLSLSLSLSHTHSSQLHSV